MSTGEGISSLWKKEDWWAVWVGFAILIFAVAMAALEYGIKAPKIQRWATSPLDAFYSDVTVKVEDWPKDPESGEAFRPALPGRRVERFHYTRKVGYQQGKQKASRSAADDGYPKKQEDAYGKSRFGSQRGGLSFLHSRTLEVISKPLSSQIFGLCEALSLILLKSQECFNSSFRRKPGT